jgi:hypothetical protein
VSGECRGDADRYPQGELRERGSHEPRVLAQPSTKPRAHTARVNPPATGRGATGPAREQVVGMNHELLVRELVAGALTVWLLRV